jgi:hypothetical protein
MYRHCQSPYHYDQTTRACVCHKHSSLHLQRVLRIDHTQLSFFGGRPGPVLLAFHHRLSSICLTIATFALSVVGNCLPLTSPISMVEPASTRSCQADTMFCPRRCAELC